MPCSYPQTFCIRTLVSQHELTFLHPSLEKRSFATSHGRGQTPVPKRGAAPGITRAEDLRPISANAILWHTRLWWLDQRGSTFHKLRTPSKSLYVRIQVTIAIPHPGLGNDKAIYFGQELGLYVISRAFRGNRMLLSSDNTA